MPGGVGPDGNWPKRPQKREEPPRIEAPSAPKKVLISLCNSGAKYEEYALARC